jgi:hypothetical protein
MAPTYRMTRGETKDESLLCSAGLVYAGTLADSSHLDSDATSNCSTTLNPVVLDTDTTELAGGSSGDDTIDLRGRCSSNAEISRSLRHVAAIRR